MDLRGFLLLVLVVTVLWHVVRAAWFYSRKRRSLSWPITSATVERTDQIRGIGRSGNFASVLRYTYKANNLSHDGFFALIADTAYCADELQKKYAGLTVTVRYDPTRPGISFVQERDIDGRLVCQGPGYLP
jgi:hypothetical protein